jgi:N5-(cytidine 5'-diphosphoramidyl)-L-glutamine hydrolase
MKNILISQRSTYNKNYKEFNDSIDLRLTSLLIEMGYRPILIPNLEYNRFLKWIKNLVFDGIVLSGGGDIGTKENKFRDKIEYYLIAKSKNKKIPLFAICRGMQILSKFYGSRLISVKNHVKKRHKVFLKNKDYITVNSYHNFSIDKCPKNFLVLTKSDDDNIESIIHKDLPVYACMWHPEREKKKLKYDKNFFKKIFGKK